MMALKEVTIASVALLVMPKALEVALENVFDYDTTLTNNEKKLFEKKTIYKLNAVSEVIEGIAGDVSEDKEGTIEEVRKFIKTLNENTCKSCENYKDCWKKNYHTMYELVFNQIDYMQSKDEIDKKELKKSICKEQEKFAEGLRNSYQIYKVNQDWQQKMKEKKMQSYKQLKGVSSAINMLTREMDMDEEEQEQNLAVEIGIAKAKKNNSSKSGDSYITTKINENKYLIGLSDGMGSGENANKKSNKVIKMNSTYVGCSNLQWAVCGDNVQYFANTYTNCTDLKTAECGINVITMNGTYSSCYSLLKAKCGPNVQYMNATYCDCISLTSAACGNKVTEMDSTYKNCKNLQAGVCGPNVINMYNAYNNCMNLRVGICGPNVNICKSAYYDCPNLTHLYIENPSMYNYGFTNLCHLTDNNQRKQRCLKIYAPTNSNTLTSLLIPRNEVLSPLVYTSYDWVYQESADGSSYYQMADSFGVYNIRLYPVENVVAQRQKDFPDFPDLPT